MELIAFDGKEWAQDEWLLLGAVFLDNTLVKGALSELQPEDFCAPAHREVFGAVKQLSAERPYFDQSAVDRALPAGALKEAGGEAYLLQLIRFARGNFIKIKGCVAAVKARSARRGHAELVKLAGVETKPVEWLWRPYLPSGMVSMLSGDPGAGKTYVALAIAAALTSGRVPAAELRAASCELREEQQLQAPSAKHLARTPVASCELRTRENSRCFGAATDGTVSDKSYTAAPQHDHTHFVCRDGDGTRVNSKSFGAAANGNAVHTPCSAATQDDDPDVMGRSGGDGAQRIIPPQTVAPMNVLYLSVENSPERVVRPRFDRLGGDPARFHLLTGVFRDLGTGSDLRSMTLSEIGVLEEAIKRTEAKLVIVDPLQSYIDAEINRAGETRPIMDSLCKLAEKNGCAMLLIRHLSKARTGRAIARGIGSIDLTGAVRSEVLAGCSEESPSERALVHVKSNVGELGPAMGYRIEGDGSFCWTGTSLLTASEMLAPEKTVEPFSALSEAEEFLREQLRDGPVALKQLVENASPRRISLRTLERAKSSLGVVARRQGGRSGASYWEWPPCEEAPRVEGASRAAAV